MPTLTGLRASARRLPRGFPTGATGITRPLPAAGPGGRGRSPGLPGSAGFVLNGTDPFAGGGGLGQQTGQTQCPPGSVPAPGGGCQPVAGAPGGGGGGFIQWAEGICNSLPSGLGAICRTALAAGEGAFLQWWTEMMGTGAGGGGGGGGRPPPPPPPQTGNGTGSRLPMVGRIGYNPNVRSIRRRQCGEGDVLAVDGKCYPKSMVPKRFREWKPARKPKISATDWRHLQRAASVEKKLKRLTKKAPGLKTAKNR